MEGLGYKVDKQVGSAGFKIDLAVRHPEQPGRYMLAVECDGATYHSGLWARERDRLRQELEHGLWFFRVWSTDWFYRRGEVAQKLRVALETALRQARRRDSQSHQARGSPTTPVNRPRQRPKQMYLICACPPTNWRKAYRSLSMQSPTRSRSLSWPRLHKRLSLSKAPSIKTKSPGERQHCSGNLAPEPSSAPRRFGRCRRSRRRVPSSSATISG